MQQILSTLQIDMKEKKLLPQGTMESSKQILPIHLAPCSNLSHWSKDRLRELEELKIYSREAQGCEQIFAVEVNITGLVAHETS